MINFLLLKHKVLGKHKVFLCNSQIRLPTNYMFLLFHTSIGCQIFGIMGTVRAEIWNIFPAFFRFSSFISPFWAPRQLNHVSNLFCLFLLHGIRCSFRALALAWPMVSEKFHLIVIIEKKLWCDVNGLWEKSIIKNILLSSLQCSIHRLRSI